mmetsp:Transcript_40755/g.95175  ORF Transcript_40755/g.95175 Transcript_40755/m.95175 type:complete len:213 (-) Transcript_40755:185-823(-)
MPARQRRSLLDQVAHRPGHAQVVRVHVHLIVGAKHVEDALVHLRLEVLDHLSGHPRPARGFRFVEEDAGRIDRGVGGALAVEHDVRIDPSGHEQVRPHLAALGRSQLVLQPLCKGVERCLAGIVGHVARWLGDALLRARVDYHTICARFEHGRQKGLNAVHGTKEVHVKSPTEDLGRATDGCAPRAPCNPGVVGEKRRDAVRLDHPGGQIID